jgi:hypothetical protein
MRRRLVLGLLTAFGLLACDPSQSPAPTAASATSTATTAARSSATATATARASAEASVSSTPETPARPLYYERAITEADLKDRTLRELSLMRNTIYARAGNRFRRPWLNNHFSKQPWYEPKDEMDSSKISELDKKNARAIADHDAAITTEQLNAWRDALLERRKSSKSRPEDEVELSLLSQRLGTWLGGDDREPTPLEDPNKLDELLTVEQLSTLSRRDLRILRNTVYARHGLKFQSKVVRSYFATAEWYEPKYGFVDDRLTKIDHKNIAMIRSVEDTLGGPLHENPDYGKDGWFFAA